MSKFRKKIDANYFELLLSRQKLDPFLENKVLQKLKLSKNVNNESQFGQIEKHARSFCMLVQLSVIRMKHMLD